MSALSRLGVLRLVDPSGAMAKGLPERQQREVRAAFATVEHQSAAREEFAQFALPDSATYEQVSKSASLADKPLVVLSRDVPPNEMTTSIQENHEQIAALSSESEHRIVEGASHFSLMTNREHSEMVIAAVRESR